MALDIEYPLSALFKIKTISVFPVIHSSRSLPSSYRGGKIGIPGCIPRAFQLVYVAIEYMIIQVQFTTEKV